LIIYSKLIKKRLTIRKFLNIEISEELLIDLDRFSKVSTFGFKPATIEIYYNKK